MNNRGFKYTKLQIFNCLDDFTVLLRTQVFCGLTLGFPTSCILRAKVKILGDLFWVKRVVLVLNNPMIWDDPIIRDNPTFWMRSRSRIFQPFGWSDPTPQWIRKNPIQSLRDDPATFWMRSWIIQSNLFWMIPSKLIKNNPSAPMIWDDPRSSNPGQSDLLDKILDDPIQ